MTIIQKLIILNIYVKITSNELQLLLENKFLHDFLELLFN